MELRVTTVFRPLSRAAGFFLSELNISPTAIAFTSFITALLSALLFAFSFQLPIISVRFLIEIAIALIFLNAFLDDVERLVETKSKKKSIFGGPLGTFLGQLSDTLILFGALFFLGSRDTYYNFGRFWPLNLSYVEPGIDGYIIMGVLLFGGILILRYVAASKKEKGTGLWTRSERMYIFGGFALLGLITGLFSGFLFSGVLFLSGLILISILKRFITTKKLSPSSKTSYKTRRAVRASVSSTLNLVKSFVRTVLRIIGVVLLGFYLTLEKLYLALERTARYRKSVLQKVKIPRKGSTPKVVHLSPAPTETEETSYHELKAGFLEPNEDVNYNSSEEPEVHETPESSTHELKLPPPAEGDASYMAGGKAGESLLVEYESAARKEEALIDMVDFMISEGKDIVIVSTQPATSHYKEKYKGVEGIRIIHLPDQATMPEDDEIPMTNLEYFSEIFENLSNDHVFIFAPLSSLILHIGISQAYRFISQVQNRLSALGVTFVVFMNSVGHDKMDVSNFENLFMNLAVIEDGKLKKMK